MVAGEYAIKAALGQTVGRGPRGIQNKSQWHRNNMIILSSSNEIGTNVQWIATLSPRS